MVPHSNSSIVHGGPCLSLRPSRLPLANETKKPIPSHPKLDSQALPVQGNPNSEHPCLRHASPHGHPCVFPSLRKRHSRSNSHAGRYRHPPRHPQGPRVLHRESNHVPPMQSPQRYHLDLHHPIPAIWQQNHSSLPVPHPLLLPDPPQLRGLLLGNLQVSFMQIAGNGGKSRGDRRAVQEHRRQ